jgi:putative transposase
MALKKSFSQKLRMDGRDYSRPGWYFLTMGADYHRHIFGTVRGTEMHPNALGRLVERCWDEIPQHYGHITLGARQVMPNHFHGIAQITHAGGKTIGEVMNQFKGSVTRLWRKRVAHAPAISRHGESTPSQINVWAPNYWDVICFAPEELAVRERYVLANPRRWALRTVPTGTIPEGQYKGNLALLRTPSPRYALRISRRANTEQITTIQKQLQTFQGTIFSTFLSPGERASLKALQESNANLVWIVPMAMPQHIPVAWTTAFLENRALWLSPFPDTHETPTRTSCEQANRWLLRLCGT